MGSAQISYLDSNRCPPMTGGPGSCVTANGCCVQKQEYGFKVWLFFQEVINVKFRKKLPVPIPAEFLILIGGTLASHFANFETRYSVRTIGDVPTGKNTMQLHLLSLGLLIISNIGRQDATITHSHFLALFSNQLSSAPPYLAHSALSMILTCTTYRPQLVHNSWANLSSWFYFCFGLNCI